MRNHLFCGRSRYIDISTTGKVFAAASVLGSLVALLMSGSSALAGTEQSFDVLQIGAHTYQNVTVTTKAKNYIFILHSGGMSNIKVAELSEDIREKLGYPSAEAQKNKTNTASLWAKQAVGRLDSPEVKQLQQKFSQAWQGAAGRTNFNSYVPAITPRVLAIFGAILLGIYLFHCYCCMLICRKTGNEPGVMVWLPVLQLIPMLRAASMSGWWFVGFFIPVINLVGHVLWCVKIVQARRKTTPLLVLLLLPVTSFFAFLYLAFSEATPKRKEQPRVEIMTLETA
jgi:uncharacterized protein DUF5684